MTADWREPPHWTPYLRDQRQRGRSLCGVFPAQYPRELLWALDLLPVEIWDPPLEPAAAGSHLQPTICPVARRGLALLLQGGDKQLDGLLFPHPCDSMQNLASVVHDCLDPGLPCHFLYNPKAPFGPAAQRYYRDHLADLSARLQRHHGPLGEDRLEQAVVQGRRVSGLLRDLYDLRADGHLDTTAAEFYRTLRCVEYLHPEDLVPLLEGFREARRGPGPGRNGPTVVLSGVLPSPPGLLTLLDDLGVRVGHDDLIACGRRVPGETEAAADPFQALADAYFALPPCTTRNSSLGERQAYLFELIDQSGARGVVFNVVTFCETELFDLPPLVEALKARGVHSVVLDTDPADALSGQLATRVEAFAELLAQEES